MDKHTQNRRSHLFIVRIWLENLGDGQMEWRGKAQSIPGGETTYFRDWMALLAFLKQIVPKAEQRPDR